MTDFVAFWAAAFDALRRVWALDPTLWDAATTQPTLAAGIGVAIVASASTVAGQSGVLFLNRVRGIRLWVSIAGGVVYLIALRTLAVLVIWAVAKVATGAEPPLAAIVTVGLLATAPMAFNAFTFLPYLGLPLARLIEAWAFVVLAFGIGALYGVGVWWGVALTASGWVVIQIASRLLAAPLGWLGSRLWTLATGRPVLVTSRDILAGTPFVPVVGEVER